MDSNALSTYWETQILTASPQKLRLLLIEGAIRFGRQVVQYWGEQKNEEAFTAMMRMQAIAFELLTSVQKNTESSSDAELNNKITGLYLFLYKSLVAAQQHHDAKGVEDVLHVLEEERETWRQVCERYPQAPSREEMQKSRPQEITASSAHAIPAPNLSTHSSFATPVNAGFSVDA